MEKAPTRAFSWLKALVLVRAFSMMVKTDLSFAALVDTVDTWYL